jgi:hypothetical protein
MKLSSKDVSDQKSKILLQAYLVQKFVLLILGKGAERLAVSLKLLHYNGPD